MRVPLRLSSVPAVAWLLLLPVAGLVGTPPASASPSRSPAPSSPRPTEDDRKLDFVGIAEDHMEEHGLSEQGLTFTDYLDSELFLRIPVGTFDVRYPVDATKDKGSLALLEEVLTAMVDVQEAWFTWRSKDPVSKETAAQWKALRKWVGKVASKKLAKCPGGDVPITEEIKTDEETLAAIQGLRELYRPAPETIEAVGEWNVAVIAPTRKHFLEIAAMGGLLDPTQQGSLWKDELIIQTAAWFKWIQILTLTNGGWPSDYEHPFNESPRKANDKTAMVQYVANRAGIALLRKEFWRHGTAFFEQALATNLVIAVAGKNGEFTQGEWKMQWTQAGASTQPYTRFVPGGNPKGGILPPRKAIPGPRQFSYQHDGVQISKYREHLGQEYFLSVLSEGQEDGFRRAMKDRDEPRRRDKTAHFEIFSFETNEATYVTAPFLGLPAEGKELPGDEYLDAYEDFFRAYRSCFLNWLRTHGAEEELDAKAHFGELITRHAARTPGAELDPIVEAIYGLPLSAEDEATDCLENRFLAWLAKNG